MSGYSAHGGSLATLPEVGLPGKGWIHGASDSLRHPSPGGETKTSAFGIAVRVLLRATSLSHCMVSSPATGRGLSASALKGCISAPLAFLF